MRESVRKTSVIRTASRSSFTTTSTIPSRRFPTINSKVSPADRSRGTVLPHCSKAISSTFMTHLPIHTSTGTVRSPNTSSSLSALSAAISHQLGYCISTSSLKGQKQSICEVRSPWPRRNFLTCQIIDPQEDGATGENHTILPGLAGSKGKFLFRPRRLGKGS
jgi:hypothetical protein